MIEQDTFSASIAMAKEILSIPEENLDEFIMVLKTGLAACSDLISEETAYNLTQWYMDVESYQGYKTGSEIVKNIFDKVKI